MKRDRAFVLLEVMLAVVIVGVAMVAIMRGFIGSLNSLKKIKRNEVAMLLGRSLMDDMVLEPPARGKLDGEFSKDPRYGEDYAGWTWTMDVEEEEPRYEERPSGKLLQDLEPEYRAEIEILYTDEAGTIPYLSFKTILRNPELFSDQALQKNQLF